jgi:hypothetical protein
LLYSHFASDFVNTLKATLPLLKVLDSFGEQQVLLVLVPGLDEVNRGAGP